MKENVKIASVVTAIVIWLVLISAVLHAAWNFSARKVAGNIAVIWIGLCLASIVSAPFAYLLSGPSLWKSLPYMILTGILNAVYFYAVARAYELGEVSHVYPIARGTGVAGAGLIGCFVLAETVPPFAAAGIAAVIAGILVLSLRPVSARHKHRGSRFAFLMGGAIVGSTFVDKLAMGFAEPVVYIFGMIAISAALLAPHVLGRHGKECVEAWKRWKHYSAVIGLGSLISYLLVLAAFQMGSLSRIVPFREISVVFGSLLGITFLKEPLSIKKGAGIFLITAGLIFLKMA